MALAGEIINAINTEKGTKAYDTTAQVVRIDGGTAWVHIAGGVDETPVSLTVNCNVGDTVQIRVSGGRAFIVGNHSAPPTDDATAIDAQNTAVYASETAEGAKETAEAVEGIAVEANETAQQADTKADSALSQVGQSIVTDTLHYLATDQGSGVTIQTQGWTTTIQSMTETNKYLWTYHTYHKASGQSVNTTPCITGVYGDTGAQGAKGDKGDTGAQGEKGDKGDTGAQGAQGEKGDKGDTGSTGAQGVSVSAVQPQYYLSTSSSSATGGSWGNTVVYEAGKYIWSRDQITYSDSSVGYSTGVYNEALTTACATAESALNIAEGVDEHFWYDNTGAHVTQVTQDEWNDSTDPNYHSGGNTLITSTGMAIRDGMKELATFGASGATIGVYESPHTIIDEDGQRFFSGGNSEMAHIGYGAIDDGQLPLKDPYFTFGSRHSENNTYTQGVHYKIGDIVRYDGKTYICKKDLPSSSAWDSTYWSYIIGRYSTANGFRLVASGYGAFAEGISNKAIDNYSHAEGYNTIAKGTAHAEGWHTLATDDNGANVVAHAEGYKTEAHNGGHAEGSETYAGGMSHAEGSNTQALRSYCHAEGYGTIANATNGSHAEGYNTTATGAYSHSQNLNTIADQDSQTAIGKYNTENNTGNLFVIGNGTSSARADAFQVDTSGNVRASGTIGQKGHVAIGAYSSDNTTKNLTSTTSWTSTGVQFTPTEGRYLILIHVTFGSNTTGRRAIALSDTVNGRLTMSVVSGAPANGLATSLQSSVYVETNGTKTYTIQYQQNSGSTMNSCDVRYIYIRLQ